MDLCNRCRIADLELDTTRMNAPGDLADRYAEPIARALKEMTALERGEPVNVDEDRAVGHYWLRNPDIAPAAEADRVRASQRHITEFAEQVKAGKIVGPAGPLRKFLLIGIGGSALAPRLLHDAFRQPGQTPPFFVLDNTDPDGFERTLAEIRHAGGLGDTLTMVISKSGGTKETRNGMLIVRHAYEQEGLVFEKHAVAMSMASRDGQRNVMHDAACAASRAAADTGGPWLNWFELWDWVGGRTSMFAPVGLVPAALLGFDHEALLAGARRMDEATRRSDLRDNPALLMAVLWLHATETLGLTNMVVLPYRDRLALLGMYLQQLVMESLGKAGKGITVFGNKGSTDQHSFVQQLREGRPDFFALFVRTRTDGDGWPSDFQVDSNVTAGDYLAAFQEGTARALHDAGRPSMRITMDRLDEASLGALVALFERAVGFYATLISVNAYHQPGVEAGKRAAGEYLELQAGLVDFLTANQGQPFTADELARQVGRPDESAVVRDIVERLVCTRRFGLTSTTASHDAASTFICEP